jgi:uncharacterized membrane protein YccC
MRLHVPDLLPSFLDGARVFVTIGTVELFWIVTEWPNGPQALVFATIGVILFAQRADQAYATVMSFMVGVALSAVFAAIVEFAVLPGVATFAGFSLAIGLVLVPAGALMAQPWQTVIFVALTANFIPLLAPANQMSYDTQQFYNGGWQSSQEWAWLRSYSACCRCYRRRCEAVGSGRSRCGTCAA